MVIYCSILKRETISIFYVRCVIERHVCARAYLLVSVCVHVRVCTCVCVCASQMTLVPAFLSNYEIEGLYLIFMRLGTPDDETWPGFRACVCA